MYVGDFFTTQSLFDVKNFYRFLHGVEETPSNKDAQAFLEKIKNVAKDDYLDFKDRLIVITRRV